MSPCTVRLRYRFLVETAMVLIAAAVCAATLIGGPPASMHPEPRHQPLRLVEAAAVHEADDGVGRARRGGRR